jgi:hypothetical protein
MFNSHADIQEGAVTPFGVITQVSLTAAKVEGEWIPFGRLVAPQAPQVSLTIPQGYVDAIHAERAEFRRVSDANVAALWV